MRALVPAANGDVSLAEFGIVYVDEVDKLAVKASQGVFGGDHACPACECSLRRSSHLPIGVFGGGGGSGVNTKEVCSLMMADDL